MTFKEELTELSHKIEAVKRDSWDLSDDVIEAYVQGKKKGKDEIIVSIMNEYVDRLSSVQSMVETAYSDMISSNVKIERAHLKLAPSEFSVLYVIATDDFHNMDKKRHAYDLAKKHRNNVDATNFLVTTRFTCSENLDVNLLKKDGYNTSFGA